jgi:hypothetical protein
MWQMQLEMGIDCTVLAHLLHLSSFRMMCGCVKTTFVHKVLRLSL